MSTSWREYLNKYIHLTESVGVNNFVDPVHNRETYQQPTLTPNVGPMVVRHLQHPAINIIASTQHLTAQPRVK